MWTSRVNAAHMREREDEGLLHFLYHANENGTISIPDSRWVLQTRQKARAVLFRISRILNNRKDIKISWLFHFYQITRFFSALVPIKVYWVLSYLFLFIANNKHSLLDKYSYKISNNKEIEEYYTKEFMGNILK